MIPRNRLTKYDKVGKTAGCVSALVCSLRLQRAREDRRQAVITFLTQAFPTPVCSDQQRPVISETRALCHPAKGAEGLQSTYSLLATVIMILASDNLWQTFPFVSRVW